MVMLLPSKINPASFRNISTTPRTNHVYSRVSACLVCRRPCASFGVGPTVPSNRSGGLQAQDAGVCARDHGRPFVFHAPHRRAHDVRRWRLHGQQPHVHRANRGRRVGTNIACRAWRRERGAETRPHVRRICVRWLLRHPPSVFRSAGSERLSPPPPLPSRPRHGAPSLRLEGCLVSCSKLAPTDGK